MKTNPLVARHLANKNKVKISTVKTTKCGKILKLKSPSTYSPTLQLKSTPTIEPCDHCHQSEPTISC